MKLSYLSFILYLAFPSAIFPQAKAATDAEVKNATEEASGKETELLDKEYGVRYANECEGRC